MSRQETRVQLCGIPVISLPLLSLPPSPNPFLSFERNITVVAQTICGKRSRLKKRNRATLSSREERELATHGGNPRFVRASGHLQQPANNRPSASSEDIIVSSIIRPNPSCDLASSFSSSHSPLLPPASIRRYRESSGIYSRTGIDSGISA